MVQVSVAAPVPAGPAAVQAVARAAPVVLAAAAEEVEAAVVEAAVVVAAAVVEAAVAAVEVEAPAPFQRNWSILNYVTGQNLLGVLSVAVVSSDLQVLQ